VTRESSSMTPVKYTETDGVLSFQTKKGMTYIVDRLVDPWETQPITTIESIETKLEPI
jgi:hypothetical protein